MLIFHLLCYAAVLKFLTYYAQYYAHVKELCLNLTVLLEYIQSYQIISYGECSIRVYQVLLFIEYIAKHFLLCWHYA